MKVKALILWSIFLTSAIVGNAQIHSLRINSNINLPKDTLETSRLVSAVNGFLEAAQQPNEENKWVLESQKLETFILLDEINGIEKSGKYKDDHFYKPYLTNVMSLSGNRYLIQVSYIGMNGDTAMCRASFRFIAHKANDTLRFSSPLVENTKNWKVKKIGSAIFHYQVTLNEVSAKNYTKLVERYDQKLKSKNKTVELYGCENLADLQSLVGVDYKADYNGGTTSVWSTSFGNKKLLVFGNKNAHFDVIDPHDLWHERLGTVISRRKVNRSVDEGCAYLYGGSWGLSWNEIFSAFKQQVASNKNINWVEVKESPVYFKTGEFDNSADYIVNALLVKKIEKEKGFDGVWELLTTGPAEKGNEKYYKKLEELTGITKSNYNEKVWELIHAE